ncbi:hypothetical protein D9758_018244 [Tetrapyrgos nigripes]|uniref:Uncharacterized protein n=1 Tax=Tetrapyrgos nigripes TaxID=182062 RepID=A0A8H5C3I3_9AGAR|nr:hypothetical protein D9758_018244 [Tetrapyrgos nigripes]
MAEAVVEAKAVDDDDNGVLGHWLAVSVAFLAVGCWLLGVGCSRLLGLTAAVPVRCCRLTGYWLVDLIWLVWVMWAWVMWAMGYVGCGVLLAMEYVWDMGYV